MTTKLIEPEDVKGTGCIYYIEGYDADFDLVYDYAFVWGDILTAEEAIAKALKHEPYKSGNKIKEWRVQALDIDTAAGEIISAEDCDG